MEKNFWAIEVHTGKMQKFATVSSQICIMRYVQRTLLLNTLVCFFPFVGLTLWEIYKERVDPCHCYNIASLFHARYKKSIEKAQNISSKLHRLNTLHVLRDWRHVRDIFS